MKTIDHLEFLHHGEKIVGKPNEMEVFAKIDEIIDRLNSIIK